MGLFDRMDDARQMVQELIDHGFQRDDVSLVSRQDGAYVTALAGAGLGATTGGRIGAIPDLGVPEEEAHYYAEGVRRGGVLVAVDTDDQRADRAAEIMDRAAPSTSTSVPRTGARAAGRASTPMPNHIMRRNARPPRHTGS